MSPLIIITDMAPSGDDAVAVAMLASHAADIKLLVATSGNVWAEDAAQAARALLKDLDKTIDVCVGAPSTALAARRRAFLQGAGPPARYNGAFGLDLPVGADAAACGDLFDRIAATAKPDLAKPDLLVIGPATPLKPMLAANRDLARHVGRVYLMGGAIDTGGNATPVSEFNFWFDAEAAEALLAADVPVTLLPLDVTRGLHYSAELAARMDPKHLVSAYVKACARDPASPPVCDELLAAILLEPGLVTRRSSIPLSVETQAGARYGAVRRLGASAGRRPVDVIEQIDRAAFWNLMRRSFAASSD